MQASDDEIQRRRETALAAIRRAHGTRTDQSAATLFISHHIQELSEEYWLKHCGTETPEPQQVLDVIVFKLHWGDDEHALDYFDFTLPDSVTQYVISVGFNENGEVRGISMES